MIIKTEFWLKAEPASDGPHKAVIRGGKEVSVIWIKKMKRNGSTVSGWKCSKTKRLVKPIGWSASK